MERIKELRMTAIILLVGIFLLSGCFFSSKHEVTFKTNGGTEVKNASVKSGNKLEIPDTPTKEGYVFEGWYLNGKEYNFDDEVNEDIILVAKWRKVDVDGEENQNDDNEDNTSDEEEPTTSKTTKRITSKKTTASGTVKKTTTSKKTTSTSTTTTKKIEDSVTPVKPTETEKPEPTVPEKPESKPEQPEPIVPAEPTTPDEPIVPENKKLKMNITITEEIIDSMLVEAKDNTVLEVIKPSLGSTEEVEETKKRYNMVIDVDSEEINTISKLKDEDLNELLSSDLTEWQINDQTGKLFELDIKDTKIALSSDEKMETIAILASESAYVIAYDEENEKWVIDYPSVMVKNEENEKYYARLDDAIKASLAGDKITILKDIDIKEEMVIDKTIAIDGGSFKINSSSEYLFNIKNVDDELKDIVIANMEVKVKSLLYVEEVKVKSITMENIKGSYENKIVDNQSSLEITLNNLKLDILETKEDNED